ncbi:MAG: peptidoglycan-binding domain-containing protein, partial [Nodosilinea sp.]
GYGLGWWASVAIAPTMLLNADMVLAQSPNNGPANPTISGGRIVRPTLRLGSQGESVKELQSLLVLLGYYGGPVTSLYQEDTERAVRDFQRAAGITPDGIVGPTTWSQLFPAPGAAAPLPTSTQATATTGPTQAPTSPPAAQPNQASPSSLPVLRPGMGGEAVRQLQEKLRAKGVYQGPIDGVFGSATEAAVREIQRRHNLVSDGIVGPETWKVL